jgi:hypothetical protein
MATWSTFREEQEVAMLAAPVDIRVSIEACTRFDADADEPGVCACCGWLEDEHEYQPGSGRPQAGRAAA